MKRFLLLLTALFALNSATHAADGDRFTCGNLEYTVISEDERTVSLTKCPAETTGDVTIPEHVANGDIRYSVTAIGNEAFYYCESVTGVDIPSSVTSIGARGFYGCKSLTAISLSASVTGIGAGAFASCGSLENIDTDESNNSYCSVDGVLYDADKRNMVQCPGARKGGYIIPEGVVSISESAFNGCGSLTAIEIPESVTTIGSRAFSYCSSLTSMVVPKGVTSLGDGAFSDCTGLTGVDLPESLTGIGFDTFSGCSSLASIDIPDGVTSIGNYAFHFCSSLTSATIPNSVTSIGTNAFQYCSSLTSLSIPNSVMSIGATAFRGCTALATVDLPIALTSIESSTFESCPALSSVIIPRYVTKIGDKAFSGCKGLKTIYSLAETVPVAADKTFLNCPKDAVVNVPYGTADNYRTATGWSYFTNFRELAEFNLDFDRTTLWMSPYETCNLSVTGNTYGGEWASHTPDIATVDVNGLVTAVAPGRAIISYSAKDADGLEHSAVCIVNVVRISITLPENGFKIDEMSEVTADVESPAAMNASYYWDLEDPTGIREEIDLKHGTCPGRFSTNIIPTSAGDYTLTFCLNPKGSDHKYKATAKFKVVTGGIESVATDNASAAYYDLNGLRIESESLAPGIYIRRKGNKTEKILVK